jgi:hypothetical protein
MTTSVRPEETPLEKSGNKWATVGVGGVHGKEAVAGGQFLLYVDIAWEEDAPERREEVESIRVHLSHDGATIGHSFLKRVNPDKRQGDQQRIAIPVQVTETTLSELENRRTAGEGIELFAKIRAFVRSQQGPDMVPMDFELALPESKWNDILAGMEYLESYLVRFPLGGEAIPERFSDAVDSYREARNLHRRGDYKQAIGNCREVFEQLPDESPFGAQFGPHGSSVEDFQTFKDWTPYERLEHVLEAIRHVTHLGHHPMEGKSPGEADSEFVLSSVGALLNRALSEA